MDYDLIVVGKGPAGLSAALNAAIRKNKVLVIGKDSKALSKSPSIKNYLGFKDIKGDDLYQRFLEQIKYYDIDIKDKKIKAVYAMGDYFAVDFGDEMLKSKACIIATGIDMGKVIEGEDKFFAKGISYCATCDASLYKGRDVVVIGYNEESIEEVEFINKVAKNTTFINMYKKNIKLSSNINIVDERPLKFDGLIKAESLELSDGSKIRADGFFIIKSSSKPKNLVPSVKMDEKHILVDKDMKTNIRGLFACGDITGKPYQINKACGEGQVAGLNASSYIRNVSRETK
ncbi:NAD(P)/FAD-dependent oxidoreductase [Anaerococcus porci]|uniref:NAD(P)/FAD-dependent oxidoreductase n=1 Tax=Anaerococcus porci TaxID=2652269 RepID=A0A6N7VRW2_9FIRM|nr:NAD(P)/FAD-dependent oxidoreductase [Anaerococcus porci]MDY3005831.1 NAD(P)/FAD-dependent oxidoreductase [Anaerococcus porci]MSS77572.1 NAD(P)/FAD-dependent oxidoreductase [Anaerococcus porci]